MYKIVHIYAHGVFWPGAHAVPWHGSERACEVTGGRDKNCASPPGQSTHKHTHCVVAQQTEWKMADKKSKKRSRANCEDKYFAIEN